MDSCDSTGRSTPSGGALVIEYTTAVCERLPG